MDVFRPLLASTLERVDLLQLPVMASPKLDGIRCCIVNGQPISRNGKPIRNKYIQALLTLPEFEGLDGELIVGQPCGADVFNRTSSGVMAYDGKPDFTYWVFDNHQVPAARFSTRFYSLMDYKLPHYIKILPHTAIATLTHLASFEREVLAEGFEGVMIRRPDGPYKHGRSTPKDGILRKLKRFRDGEAKIIGVQEGVMNLNEATIDALGYTERSTKQEKIIAAARVGTIIGEDLESGQVLNISPGRMTYEQRIKYWQMPQMIIGRVAKYKTFDYGAMDAPRFTTFQAFLDGRP